MKRKFSLGWRLIVVLALVASLGMVFAAPTAVTANLYDSQLTLENKDTADWQPIADSRFGTLDYKSCGPTFEYSFSATGLETDTDYTLIYYADFVDRWPVWGGNNPGAVIGTGHSDGGALAFSGSIELNMHLPCPPDANISFYDYSGDPDNYPHAHGAKIWLVPSSALTGGSTLPVIVWQPARFLFETDLITYTDTDLLRHLYVYYPHKVFVCDEFDVDVEVCLDEDTCDGFIDDAVVRLTIVDGNGTAILVDEGDNPVPVSEAEHWVGDVCPGKCRETSFKLQCIKPGKVDILIEVFEADDPGTIVLSRAIHVHQKCKLEVDIITPTDSTNFAISGTFAVTAEVKNRSKEICDAEVCLTLDPPTGRASLVGGSACYQVGPIAPGDTQEVNWTVHCDAAGDVDLTVTATGCGQEGECADVCSQTITIHQPPIEVCDLELTIDPLTVGEVCVSQNFPVTGTIKNLGTTTVSSVGGRLLVTAGLATPDTTGWKGASPSSLAPGATATISWTVHCDGRELQGDGEECLDEWVDFTAQARAWCEGSYTYAPDVPLDDYANQKYAIVTITHPADCTDICIGQEIDVTADVKNCFAGALGGTIEIWPDGVPPGITLTNPAYKNQAMTITGGATATVPVPWHIKCTAGGDINIIVKFLGINPPGGPGTTACDIDTVQIHQKTKASIDVTLKAPDCAKVCEDYVVTATIWNDGGEHATKVINISADLVEIGGANILSTTSVTGLGPLGPGDEPIVVTWDVHCDGCENVEFTVNVSGDNKVCGGTVSDHAHAWTKQVDFDVTIIEPDPCTDYYVSDTFCVTAELTNTDCDDDCTVNAVWIEFPSGKAELVEGETNPKTLPGTMSFEDTKEVSWTVHCTEPGETDILVWADVTCDGCDVCPEWNVYDSITVQQETPKLKVEILSPDDSTFVATSQEFAVTAVVTNPTHYGKGRIAYNVPVTINPGENASVIGDEEQVILELLPGESVILTWTLHCDKPGPTYISVTVPEMWEPWCEKSLTKTRWEELQGYYFSWMYDDTGDMRYKTFMYNPEMADPDRYDINNNPDIYPDYLEWQDLWHGLTGIIVQATEKIDPDTTFYYLAKVIAPEGTELMVRAPHGVAVTLIDTMGPFRLYQVKTDIYTTIEMGDEFKIIPIPSNAGVHIAMTWDINYAEGYDDMFRVYHLPDDWWAWLTTAAQNGDVGCWDKLDWHVTRCSPSPEIMNAITVHQYPAAHLEVDIDRYPEEPVVTCTEFPIHATITNTGWADATEVYATLSVKPEESVRVSEKDPDGGYTKYIGTIPGHDSPNNTAEVEWLLHCKVACNSTITITVSGMDEYGLSFSEQTTWYEGGGYIQGHVVGDIHGCAHVSGYIEGWVCAGGMCLDERVDLDGGWLFVAGEFHGEACFDAHVEAFIRGDVYFNGWVNEFTMIEDPFGPIPDRFIEPDSITVKQITPAQLVVDISFPADGAKFNVCNDFVVTTTVTNIGEETADNVHAILSVFPVDSATITDADKTLDPIIGGDSEVVIWDVHCDEVGFSVFQATATWTGELSGNDVDAFDTVTVKQGEIPDAQLVVDISYPENGAEFIEGDEFPVTATITNLGERTALNVDVDIDISANASEVSGPTGTWPKNIGPTSSAVASWTLQCTAAGFSVIVVTAEGDNSNIAVDPVTVKQIAPPEPYLTVEISAPGQVVEGETFYVTTVVSNIGDDLEEAPCNATIQIGGPADLADGETSPKDVGPIASGSSVKVEWELTCTGEGGVNVAVSAEGDANTAIDSAGVQQIAAFEDTTAPMVTVYVPNGGETWQGGTQQAITWSATDDVTPQANLDISIGYSIDGGTNWLEVVPSTVNDGAYKWLVPTINSSQCLVQVIAIDDAGNSGFDISYGEFTIYTPPAWVEEYGIELEEGWNLISLPLIPFDTDIDDVLDDISGSVLAVWAYDPTDPLATMDGWLSWAPGYPPSTLLEMKDGPGYWIEMTASATLTIYGTPMPAPGPIPPPAYDVYEGWNLIGFKSLGPMAHDTYLYNILGDYTVIWGYKDGAFFLVFPSPPGTGELETGFGFWMWMTTDGVIIPPGL